MWYLIVVWIVISLVFSDVDIFHTIFTYCSRSLRILNAQQRSFSWCCYRKWPQGGSTSSCHNLFFFFSPLFCNFHGFPWCLQELRIRNFLVISYWNVLDFWCLFQAYRNSINLYIGIYLYSSDDYRVVNKLPCAIQYVLLICVHIWYMYTCESWTIKRAEYWRIDACELEKTLASPLGSNEIKPVNLKRNLLWIFTGRADAEAEAPILRPPDAKSQLTGKRPWCW